MGNNKTNRVKENTIRDDDNNSWQKYTSLVQHVCMPTFAEDLLAKTQFSKVFSSSCTCSVGPHESHGFPLRFNGCVRVKVMKHGWSNIDL